jgi:hypothetical protein
MSLNDASDELFDVPDSGEVIDFGHLENGWFPEGVKNDLLRYLLTFGINTNINKNPWLTVWLGILIPLANPFRIK